jgi:mutator protein MutT
MRRFEVGAAIIWDGSEVLVTRRRPEDHQGGRWEFPGGKRHAGETIEGCLIRELREEIGVTVAVGPLWRALTHVYPDRSVTLHFHFCTITEGRPRTLDVSEIRWARPESLPALDFVEGDLQVLPDLVRDLASLARSGSIPRP